MAVADVPSSSAAPEGAATSPASTKLMSIAETLAHDLARGGAWLGAGVDSPAAVDREE
jgi:hypothetical protein